MYKEIKDIEGNLVAIRDTSNNDCIPLYDASPEYQKCLKWLAEGNILEPADEETIQEYRANKKAELIAFIKDNYFETTRTKDEIVTKWQSFKNNLSSLETKEEVDSAVQIAVIWLGL